MSWPDGLEQFITKVGLVKPADNANTVLCDACHEGHVAEVTFIESPPGSPVRAYIYCPECGRVAVPLERLKQWAIHFPGIASSVAACLDLTGQVEEVAPGRIWFLGKATMAGRSREVFLARGLGWVDASDVIGGCTRLNAAGTALVFVPGDPPPEEIWKGDRPSIVPLKTIASLTDRGLALDRDHVESLLFEGKRKKPLKVQKSFPTPAGIG